MMAIGQKLYKFDTKQNSAKIEGSVAISKQNVHMAREKQTKNLI